MSGSTSTTCLALALFLLATLHIAGVATGVKDGGLGQRRREFGLAALGVEAPADAEPQAHALVLTQHPPSQAQRTVQHTQQRAAGTARRLMAFMPPPPAPVRAHTLAYVLLGSGARDAQLLNVLRQIRDHLLPWTPGDVLLFHTGEYDNTSAGDARAALARMLPAVQFLHVPPAAWQLPPGLSERDAPTWKYAPCCPYPMHGVGYRHMCRWYANAVFHHLHGLGYQWVFRLDDDSEVLSPVKQNMASWMEAHGKVYGFRLWDQDDPEVIWSLPEITQWYITAREIQPKWLYSSCLPRRSPGLNSRGGWNRRVIYNNMFMANISWWLSQEVQSYLQTLEESRGYYLYRWGDAPVHTMVVGLFLERRQVHRFGFAYCHKGSCDAARTYFAPALSEAPP